MDNNTDVQQLIDDLIFVKKAIVKNSNILKLINLGQLLSGAIFAAGVVTILLSGTIYLFIQKYGSFAEMPGPLRGTMLFLVALLVVGTGVGKLYSLVRYVNRSNNNLTVRRLVGEIYTPRALHILIPYLTATILIVFYLVANQHIIYLVPALAILTGLLCLAYVNVFYMRELVFTGDWLLATGLLTLFLNGSLHPLLATILTFGLGFCTIYPANRILERHQ